MKYQFHPNVYEIDKKTLNKYADKLRECYERRFVSRNHFKGVLKRFADEIFWGIKG